MISRRDLIAGSAVMSLRAADSPDAALRRGLTELERTHGGRLGVAVLNTAGGKLIAQRGGDRFALCSTCKFLEAAFVLARVDRKLESLSRRVTYKKADLLPHSPTTEQHTSLSVGELCEAAVTVSDNTAANLLLDSFGGPARLTAYMRSLGDRVTRLDRRETALNEATPGDPRDTSTPVAMLEALRKTVLGTALSTGSREQLTEWLAANTTGDKRLRAGAPKGWRVGDKTGSGGNNTTNDIAVLWPPSGAPVIVAAYYAESRGSEDQRNAVLAEVGRLAAGVVTG